MRDVVDTNKGLPERLNWAVRSQSNKNLDKGVVCAEWMLRDFC